MKRYGLIGFPLHHSFSPQYFEDKFKVECIDAAYTPFELEEITEFPDLLLRHQPLSGLNVTIPHKVAIIPFLDELSAVAKQVGAVNTIVFKNEKMIGHNTDVHGFEFLLESFDLPQENKVLILGNGGASQAVKYVLDKKEITYSVAERIPKDTTILHIDRLKESDFEDHNIIINCTSVGTFPDVNATLPLPFHALTENHVVIDLIYNPEETVLLQNAKKAGAQFANGLVMLQTQAEASYDLWQL